LSSLDYYPSWLPREDLKTPREIDKRNFLSGGTFHYKAQSLEIESMPDALVLEGFTVDTVDLQRSFMRRHELSDTCMDIVGILLGFFNSLDESYAGRTKYLRIFWPYRRNPPTKAS
jgi:hypothetical protein